MLPSLSALCTSCCFHEFKKVMWNSHQSHLMQRSAVYTVYVAGFSNLLHVFLERSLTKLLNAIYLEGLTEN